MWIYLGVCVCVYVCVYIYVCVCVRVCGSRIRLLLQMLSSATTARLTSGKAVLRVLYSIKFSQKVLFLFRQFVFDPLLSVSVFFAGILSSLFWRQNSLRVLSSLVTGVVAGGKNVFQPVVITIAWLSVSSRVNWQRDDTSRTSYQSVFNVCKK